MYKKMKDIKNIGYPILLFASKNHLVFKLPTDDLL